MPPFTQVDNAIEGLAVSGHSRHPIKNRGLQLYKNRVCFRFVASFDVRAQVDEPIPEGLSKFEEISNDKVGDQIICEAALIHSDKNKYSQWIEKGSSTHKANYWHFSHQTMAKISRAHEEIQNAISRRALDGGQGSITTV